MGPDWRLGTSAGAVPVGTPKTPRALASAGAMAAQTMKGES